VGKNPVSRGTVERRFGLDKPARRADPAAMARGSEPTTVDLLILGAGMIGLTLAQAFARAGLRVALLDRVDPAAMLDRGFDGRVCAIAYGSRRIFEGLNVWDAMAAQAQPINEIRVVDGDSPLFLHYDHRDVGDEPLGHIVENRHIRGALMAALAELPAGALTWFAPAAVAELKRDTAGVRATLEDGRTIAARLVIVAEGRNSKTREDAGIGVLTWRYPQTGIVCTVAHEKPHRGVAIERFLPAGPFAILPLTGNRSSLVWTERSDLAPAILALDDAGFGAEMERRFGDFLGKLEVVGERWSYPLALLNARHYTETRLVLVGDAAHAIHPISGQGLNLGLRDVAALAEVLVDAARLGLDLGTADLLESYARWRRFDAVTIGAVTDGLNRLFSNDLAPVRLARGVGLALVEKAPPLKRVFMRHAMGTLGNLPRLARGEPL
jgi:2-octaprenyl-6-methoxyphenol hydroxylase